MKAATEPKVSDLADAISPPSVAHILELIIRLQSCDQLEQRNLYARPIILAQADLIVHGSSLVLMSDGSRQDTRLTVQAQDDRRGGRIVLPFDAGSTIGSLSGSRHRSTSRCEKQWLQMTIGRINGWHGLRKAASSENSRTLQRSRRFLFRIWTSIFSSEAKEKTAQTVLTNSRLGLVGNATPPGRAGNASSSASSGSVAAAACRLRILDTTERSFRVNC